MNLKVLGVAGLVGIIGACTQAPEQLSEDTSIKVSNCLDENLKCINVEGTTFIDIEESSLDGLSSVDLGIIENINEKKELIKYLQNFDNLISALDDTTIYKALYYSTNKLVDNPDNYYDALSSINKSIGNLEHIYSFSNDTRQEIISRLKYMKI